MSIFHSIPICCRYCKSYSIIPLFACWSHSLPCQCLIDVLKNYYIFFSLFFFSFFFFQAFTALFYIIKAFPWEFLTLGNAPCSHSDPWQPGNDFFFFFFPLWICAATLSTRLAAPVEAQLVTLSAAWCSVVGSSTPVPVTSRDERFLCQVIYLACQGAILWLRGCIDLKM